MDSASSQSRSLARLALAALWLLMVAPVVAHTLWRPLLVGLDADGNAGWISIAAVLVAAAAVVGQARWPTRAAMRWGCATAMAIGGAAATMIPGGSGLGILAALGALLAVAGLASATLPVMLAGIPVVIESSRSRVATLAMVLLGLVAVVQTARLSTFMGDADRIECVVLPAAGEHLTHHACSTAYYQAATLAGDRVDNLYDASWWPALGVDSETSSRANAEAKAYAPFGLDTYAYPPQFLVLPRLLLAISTDFAVQRSLWFGLNGLFLAFGLWFVAAWVGERDSRAGVRALLLGPLIWTTFPILITLQVGNIHLVVVTAAVVGMIAFERKRPALGGALLAFAILTKISPGLLGIVLLVQKRWREALWTAGFGLGWTLLAVVVFGPAPFEAFIFYELPRLSSGEALEFFTNSVTDISLNMAPFGLPFKLEALGVSFTDVWASAAAMSTIFTLVALPLTILAGLRGGDRRIDVGLWLAVLTLGSLRSPFAPGYVGFSVLWLLCLWATEVERTRGVVALALAFMILNGMPPTPAPVMLTISIVTQIVMLGLAIWFIVRPRRRKAQNRELIAEAGSQIVVE